MKVESQGFIRCRHNGHILNQVCLCLYFVVIKTFILNIKVVRGSLLSCAVVVVVIKSCLVG